MTRTILFSAALLVLLAAPCRGEGVRDPNLAALIRYAGVDGCVALLPVGGRLAVSDPARCAERLVPASSFKVANALIALSLGLAREDEIFRWDGTRQFLADWERDLDLRGAMAASAVPVFQRIARRIGRARMAAWLERIGYGNGVIGERVDRFWLDGPLAVSPAEQARFLARIASGDLPVPRAALDALRRVLPRERFGGTVVYGKTGWAMGARPMIGWYVGFAERDGEAVAFAVALRMRSSAEAPLRRRIALAALRLSGWIGAEQERLPLRLGELLDRVAQQGAAEAR